MNEAAKTVSEPVNASTLTAANIANFWAKVDKRGPNDCWLWAGSKSRGYGYASVNGKMRSVHRLSYEIHNGLIPEGEGYHGNCVCHRCDVPLCVNPSHLFLGSHYENVRDMIEKGRKIMKMPRGEANGARKHPEKLCRGSAHKCAKLNEEQVREIRKLYAAGGTSHKKLAAKFNVAHCSIRRIILRHNWAHID